MKQTLKILTKIGLITSMVCFSSISYAKVKSPFAKFFSKDKQQETKTNDDDKSQANPNKFANLIDKIEQSRLSEEQVAANTNTPKTQSQTKAQPKKPALTRTQMLEKREQEKKNVAFKSMVEELFPLSEQQIFELRKKYESTRRATSATSMAPPTPTTTTIGVSLAPGAPHPIIRLTKGFVSSLIFVDTTGQPWPIVSYSVGDGEAFNIEWDQASNALFVQSNFDYVHGNIAVRLKDLNTPLMLSFVSGQREIDYRVDLRVDGRGPFATAPIIDDMMSSAKTKTSKILTNLLDGIAPAGSRKLKVSEEYGQAWLKDNKLYFRTSLTLLSPAWVSTINSGDGTKVYELQPTPSLLASKDGNTFNVNIRGI